VFTPVVGAGPIVDQIGEIVAVHAAIPPESGGESHPSIRRQSVPQIVEYRLADGLGRMLRVVHAIRFLSTCSAVMTIRDTR
jgi:hypothetical protein